MNYGRDHQYSIARLLVNLEELNIEKCWKMETIVRSTDENEKEDQMGMTLFPKLNSFDLDLLPTLESLCPDASTTLWSAAKVMSVKRCNKLKTLASVIPQIKTLEKDSTAHHKDKDKGISSGTCGCTPYSCGPMTKPTSRTNIVQILPRPINQEVTPTNLDQDSNDYDNLERLCILSCESLEVVFQLKGPKFNACMGNGRFTTYHRLRKLDILKCIPLWQFAIFVLVNCSQAPCQFNDLKVGNCEKIEHVIAKADTKCADQEITFPRMNSMTLQDLPKTSALFPAEDSTYLITKLDSILAGPF
ncbi:hypothetical protein L3X38_037521 [Prunus dulcis]|uniref:Disease resistance protein At4g27190-like leucine-rich repeats domain-containing protein n=2 Tax=Prunus dulcis TaxID=3755 RepID=A0AAD4YQR7_PRUDU|nr:hypothetical protein L3X38_037521 [Prunus dulcis]